MGGVMRACPHCGHGVVYRLPPAPARPGWIHLEVEVIPPEERKPGVLCDDCQDEHPACYSAGIVESELVEV